MGRRPVQNKKLPADYPQMAFRVSKADKTALTAAIESIQAQLNKHREPGAPFVNKNDVIIRAIRDGLVSIKRGLSKDGK